MTQGLIDMKYKHKIAYMKTAKAFAECSSSGKLKVGAVIVKDNRIIGVGYNAQPEHITAAMEDDNGTTLPTVRHAEMSALMGLLRAGISPVGATMFTTHGCCLSCAVAVVDAGIKKVYWSEQHKLGEGILHLKNNSVEVEKFVV